MAERIMTGIEALEELTNMINREKHINSFHNVKINNLKEIVVKDLENFEKCKLENCDYQIQISELQDKYDKLKDIEEELGISIPILFNALFGGIWFLRDDWDNKSDFEIRPELHYSDGLACYVFELHFGLYYVKLKDYKKTWSLRRSDLENE